MEDWLTYRLSDLLLFSPRTYYRLFELYNRDLWPVHAAALVGGVSIVAMLRRREPRRSTAIGVLSVCWLWIGWAFHVQRYATINWIAPYFGGAFALQGLLMLGYALHRSRRPAAPAAHFDRAALGLVLFALCVQPLIGPLVGREWTQLETFGAAPDPTAIATLGILRLSVQRVPRHLVIIPAGWCAISGATLWAMGSPDALVVPLAGMSGVAIAMRRSKTGGEDPSPESLSRAS
jgi:Family of unknown function (DUF6064)